MFTSKNIANQNFWKEHSSTLLLLILLAFTSYYCIIKDFGEGPIQVCDEARNAVSAIEMNNNHDYMVVHFNDKPAVWSVKPPLLTWAQVISIKAFGVSAFAVRLPSVVAALLLCALLIILLKKITKDINTGIISSIILVSSKGLLDYHGFRFADYEAFLMLFLTVYTLCFYLFITTKKRLWLILFAINLGLAVMTKGIAGLFLLFPIFIFTAINDKSILSKNIISLIKSSAIVMLIILCYYVIREQLQPGFIKLVWNEDIWGRYYNNRANNNIFFYLEEAYRRYFSNWIILFVMAGFYFIFKKDKFARYQITGILTLTIILSLSKSKAIWYISPITPLLSTISAMFLIDIYNKVSNFEIFKRAVQTNIIPTLLLLTISYIPLREAFSYNSLLQDKNYYYQIDPTYYKKKPLIDLLNKATKEKILSGNYALIYPDYKEILEKKNGFEIQDIMFYMHVLKAQNIGIKFKPLEDIKVNEQVITNNADSYNYLLKHFKTTQIYGKDGVFVLMVNEEL